MTERRVKLERDGGEQFVRIPLGFELPGDEAVIRREGARLIFQPPPKGGLLELLATLEPIEDEWPDIDDLPAEPVDL